MVIEELAPRFPQLYVAPVEGNEDAYKKAALKGEPPQDSSLSHFEGSDMDWLRVFDTQAGQVEVLFLKKRHDFENFLRCIGHRAQPVEIPSTIGAITYTNLADWQKINQGVAEGMASGLSASEAFKALTANPANFRIALIAISEGPNSAVPAEKTPYDKRTWLKISRDIRTYHELCHFVCRRVMPDDKPAILDEVTADFNGIVHALGHYDASLAALLLGVNESGYYGGRLEEYLTDEQKADIDEIAREAYALVMSLERDYKDLAVDDSIEAVLAIKRAHPIAY
jgi:hypothetical protein